MSAFIVSAAARTPIGLDARTTGFLLRAGMPALSEAPLADDDGEAITMGWVPTIDPKLTGAERLATLARGTLEQIAPQLQEARCQLRVALDEDLPESNLACGVVQGILAKVLPKATINVDPKGESALGTWLPEAITSVETRVYEAVILGGVHSDYDPRSIRRLEAGGRLFSKDNLDGRHPGESAAFVVVMRDAEAARRGWKPRARLVGAGTGHERARPDNDHPAWEALGMTAAVKQATRSLAAGGPTAGWMITDLTPEMRRLREWEAVFARTSQVLGQPYIVESPAQRLGYLGAAALPLFVAMTVVGWEHGYAPSPLALAMAGNDGGDRAALVLGKA